MKIVFDTPKSMPKDDYERMVLSASKTKPNFPINCSTKEHYKICKKYLKIIKRFDLGRIVVLLGKPYSYFAYNSNTRKAILQFNDRGMWEGLRKFSETKSEGG